MPSRTVKPTDKQAIAKLELVMVEERRFHDEITISFRGLRSKILYFIGATLALVTFLYAGALSGKGSVQDRLFVPHELYGDIFYFFGLSCVLYALVILVRGARPDAQWSAATVDAEKAIDPTVTEQELLTHLINDYQDTSANNLKVHTKKSEAVRDSFYPLLIGAIILVVLRFFQ